MLTAAICHYKDKFYHGSNPFSFTLITHLFQKVNDCLRLFLIEFHRIILLLQLIYMSAQFRKSTGTPIEEIIVKRYSNVRNPALRIRIIALKIPAMWNFRRYHNYLSAKKRLRHVAYQPHAGTYDHIRKLPGRLLMQTYLFIRRKMNILESKRTSF